MGYNFIGMDVFWGVVGGRKCGMKVPKDTGKVWGETIMDGKGPSFGRRRGQLSGDIEPVRRRTTYIIAFTMIVIAGLVVGDHVVKRYWYPVEEAVPGVDREIVGLESNPGNDYVKAVVAGRFAEVFDRTAWMQVRADLLREEYGRVGGDVATDEFFGEMQSEFEDVEDGLMVVTEDGIGDRALFGRATGFELLKRSEGVMWPDLRPDEFLSEYRYRLSYSKGMLAVMSGGKVKTMEVSLLVTGGGKVVKACVEGNAMIHPDTIELY